MKRIRLGIQKKKSFRVRLEKREPLIPIKHSDKKDNDTFENIKSIFAKEYEDHFPEKFNEFVFCNKILKKKSNVIIINKIIDFLKEERGDYKNPLEFMARDYFRAVLYYYKNRIKRMPFISQFSPSPDNQLRWYNKVKEVEEYYEESYYKKSCDTYSRTVAGAKADIKRCEETRKYILSEEYRDEMKAKYGGMNIHIAGGKG